MTPEPAGEEVEAALVAAHLVAAEEQAILVANEKIAREVPAKADLANHPARGAAIQIQVRIGVEQILEPRKIFGIPTHVRAEPGVMLELLQKRFPDGVVFFARAILGDVGVFSGVPGVGVADVRHEDHSARRGLLHDLVHAGRVEAPAARLHGLRGHVKFDDPAAEIVKHFQPAFPILE